MKKASDDPLTKAEFEALSEFRFQIRRFERFSEDAVQACGITPLQYLLLLHLKGYPGREQASIGELAERLLAHLAALHRSELRSLGDVFPIAAINEEGGR